MEVKRNEQGASGAYRAVAGLTGPQTSGTTWRGLPLVIGWLAWASIALVALAVSAASFTVLLGERSLEALFGEGVFTLNPELQDGFQRLGLSERVILAVDFSFRLVGIAVFSVLGAVIFLRKSRDWMTGLVSLMLVTLGAAWFAPIHVLSESSDAWENVVDALGGGVLSSPYFGRSVPGLLVFLFLCLFPDGRFVPRWAAGLVGAVVLEIVLWTLFPGSPFDVSTWPQALQPLWTLGIPLTGLLSQLYRYWVVSDAAQRRQTRLVVSALILMGAVPALLVVAPDLGEAMPWLTLVTPRVEALYELILLFVLAAVLLMLPFSIAVSVVRYRLWDIRVVINRALVYGALSGLVALVYLAGILVLGEALGRLIGTLPGSNIAVLACTVAVTLLFQPARRRLQAIVDRHFYRRKYDAARTLQSFAERLRDQVDLHALVQELLSVVQQTLQPAHVSLWLRDSSASEATARGAVSHTGSVDGSPRELTDDAPRGGRS